MSDKPEKLVVILDESVIMTTFIVKDGEKKIDLGNLSGDIYG